MGIIGWILGGIGKFFSVLPLIVPIVIGVVVFLTLKALVPAISFSLIIVSIGGFVYLVLSGLGEYKRKVNQGVKEKGRVISLSKDGENLQLDSGENVENLWGVIRNTKSGNGKK